MSVCGLESVTCMQDTYAFSFSHLPTCDDGRINLGGMVQSSDPGINSIKHCASGKK